LYLASGIAEQKPAGRMNPKVRQKNVCKERSWIIMPLVHANSTAQGGSGSFKNQKI
jgi:hypothetical protein